MRPWRISDLDDEEDETRPKDPKDDEPGGLSGFFHSLRRPVFFRARDSWYFEPLLALAIIVVLLVSLFAYTSNWPPIFVVESGSMQHGSGDTVGLINTGDLVLVRKVPVSSIVPYVVGEQTGYVTYGEYGDVVLYHPNGNTLLTPVIHRAILYLQWNPTGQDFSAPSLASVPCGNEPGAVYSVAGAPNGCGWSNIITSLTLYQVGWRDLNITIPLGALGHYSGFITMGDNNPQPDQILGISGLVAGSWVIGVARGMIPWVGAFKLLLDGNAQYVPAQSWELLALTLAAIVLGGYGLHYLFRVEGIEDPRRLAEEEAEERDKADEREGGPEWADRPKGARWKGLRAWLAAPDDEEDEPTPPRSKKSSRTARAAPAPKAAAPTRTRGRPRPKVKKPGLLHRSTPKTKASPPSDEDTL